MPISCQDTSNYADGIDPITKRIQAAVLAERERCAKIAESFDGYWDKLEDEAVGSLTGEQIAAKIRNDK